MSASPPDPSGPALPALPARVAPGADGLGGSSRAPRIARVRVVSQAFFLGLFLFLLWVAWPSRLAGYPSSLLLEIDPLAALATALSTHTVYRHLAWALVVLVPTLLLGRAFCGWVCPFGTLHQLAAWLFDIRSGRDRTSANRYRATFQAKYLLLVALLVMALLGSLQTGLLDPMSLLFRSFTVAVVPAVDAGIAALAARGLQGAAALAFKQGAPEPRVFAGAWLVGAFLLGLLGANLLRPRFFCRVLCPLGAFLGVLSRFAPWRIDRDVTKCADCDQCRLRCEGAADPQAALRRSECFVCFNCIDDCPEGALRFRLAARPSVASLVTGNPADGTATLNGLPVTTRTVAVEVTGPDLPRRRLLFTAVAGVLAYPFLRLSKDVNRRGFDPRAIRPPGSVAEPEFLERCVKCGACTNVCPTNVLQPARLAIAGLEGLWTPVMDFSVGFCQLACTLCGEVCPTGAIRKTSVERKLGLGRHAGDGPVRVGTAFMDRGRCLPWAMETACVVCEEVCPTSPKAIGTYDEVFTRWDGRTVALRKPYVRPELCTGCGLCQRECPVVDRAAVYVTAIGETRSTDRTLLMARPSGG